MADEIHDVHGRPSSRRKIVRESKWLRVREVKPNVFQMESKLLQDGLEPDPEQIDRTWSEMSQRDRLDLCQAYSSKRRVTKSDERILNIIMERGDEVLWRNLASVLTRHSDRAMVSAFLRERAAEQPAPVANYYQALEAMGDKEAVPVLAKRYETYKRGGGIPDLTDRALCLDYLTCCRTLWKLTGTDRYRQDIEEHVNAPSKFLRDLARRLLDQRP